MPAVLYWALPFHQLLAPATHCGSMASTLGTLCIAQAPYVCAADVGCRLTIVVQWGLRGRSGKRISAPAWQRLGQK